MKPFLFPVLALLFSCSPNPENAPSDAQKQDLRDTLLWVMEQDQYYRNLGDALSEKYGPDSDTVQSVYKAEQMQDSLNLLIIRNILDQRGWPSRSTVGDTAVLAPFFVLQHSADAEVMNAYFPLVKAMVENGNISPRMLAYYTDRLAMLRKEPQVFGTQVIQNPTTGRMELYPVVSPDSLDIRRKAAELGPVNRYLQSMGADTISRK